MPSFDTKAYNLAEGPLSVTCLLWSLWKSAQIRPSWKPRKISMHMLSGGLIEAGSKALQSFCLHYTCFMLHYSSEVPAMSMPYPKPAGAAKTSPVIATSACQTPPPHWALGWKTQTISSETSVVTLSKQTEESPWLEYRGVESRWQGRDVCQQEQKGRKRYAKKGYTDRCKDKRNGCTVHETFIKCKSVSLQNFPLDLVLLPSQSFTIIERAHKISLWRRLSHLS